MTWQYFVLLFVAMVATCFLIAFIEIMWKSRRYYYRGKAKPRGGDHNKH